MSEDSIPSDQTPGEEERLLSQDNQLAKVGSTGSMQQIQSERARRDSEERSQLMASRSNSTFQLIPDGNESPIVYKVYKRRWFGLIQLILLNIVVSWDWLSYSPVSNTAATFFSTTSSVINWLSSVFLFAYVVASPMTFYVLRTGGPRLAIMTSSVLILLGNWLRYGGTRCSPPSFPLVMTGQILIGLAQPFVLAAPTHYSELWFSPAGRVSATAVASLANPFGGALGQLINPFLAPAPPAIPKMTLYVAIISSVATIPSFFLPSKPPTPSSPSSTHPRPAIRKTLSLLSKNPNFYLLFFTFSIYVGLFNSLASLLTQILTPYGFSETESGIAGALLILVGLVAAAITSPLVDRSRKHLAFIKILVPVSAACFIAFIWAPPARTAPAPYLILAMLGASNFSLMPVALEWMVETTFPAGPEAGSTVCWAGGNLLGVVFILVSDALKAGDRGNPPWNMQRALVFQAVIAAVAVPAALALGYVGSESRVGRDEVDKRGGIRG